MADLASILRTGHVLSSADVKEISRHLEPPWQRRARTLAERDAAIVAALGLVAGDTPTRRACELSRQLLRYFGGPHRAVDEAAGPPPGSPALRHAMHAITQLGCRPLGWRQILEIWKRRR